MGALLLLLLSFSAFAQADAPVEPKKAKWTVMVYMDGDSANEFLRRNDIEDMIRGQEEGSDDVRVIALFDRNNNEKEKPLYKNEYQLKDWNGARIIECKKQSYETLEVIGDVNLAAPKPLLTFVNRAIAKAPAEKYALIFGGEGFGWTGMNGNKGSSREDWLTLTELGGALNEIKKLHGKLDLIHFDNSFMGSVETAVVVAHNSKWMSASAGYRWSKGADYRVVLAGLNENPDMDGKSLGRIIIGSCIIDNSRYNLKVGWLSFILLDCEQVPALVTKLKALEDAIYSSYLAERDENSPKKYAKWVAHINDALAGSLRYRGLIERPTTADEPIDLLQFCKKLQSLDAESKLTVTSTEEVIQQLTKTIVETKYFAGVSQDGALGLSINIPIVTKEKLSGSNFAAYQKELALFDEGGEYKNTLFSKLTNWSRWIWFYYMTSGLDSMVAERRQNH